MSSATQVAGDRDESKVGARRSPTVFDLRPPTNRIAQIGRVPLLARHALALVWSAARPQLVTLISLQVVVAGAVAVQLLVLRELLGSLVAVGGGGSVSALYPWLAALAGVTAAVGVLGALTAYEQMLLGELTARRAFDRIIEVSAAVDLEAFENADFHDGLQRARNSGLYRLMDVVSSTTALTTGLLTSLGIAVVLLLLQPLLLALVVLAGIFPLLAAIHNGRQSYEFEYGMTPESRERHYLLELLTERDPGKEIRIFGAAPFLRRRYERLTDERISKLRIFLWSRLKVALTGTLGSVLGTVVALCALIALLASGRMAAATAMTAALAMQQLGARLTGLTGSVGRLIESGMFIEDFRSFVALAERTESSPTDRAGGASRPAGHFETLELEGISFRYPETEKLVLDDVSLRVGPGEVVALVGENGSGKTTLVKLICQLYRPDAGRILWNGRDTAGLSSDGIRSETTVLFQDYIHYHLSARDNIVLGRAELSAEERGIREAAVRAGADRFLEELPRGYDTRLGREFYGGHELSVGQWQRLALARAFYRGGSFVVLDEPTASLDPLAEADLFAQMRSLARGRSVLLVSHRFSSVRTADRIYLLERGRIVEQGNHESLLALGGRYAHLFELQAGALLARAAPVG